MKTYEETSQAILMSEIVHFTYNYKGDNEFILSCKAKMENNYPLSNKQIVALKKCYAYFIIGIAQENIEKILNQNQDDEK
jgi:hypothetical protein